MEPVVKKTVGSIWNHQLDTWVTSWRNKKKSKNLTFLFFIYHFHFLYFQCNFCNFNPFYNQNHDHLFSSKNDKFHHIFLYFYKFLVKQSEILCQKKLKTSFFYFSYIISTFYISNVIFIILSIFIIKIMINYLNQKLINFIVFLFIFINF